MITAGSLRERSVSEVRKLSILYRFVTAIASISRIDRPQTSRFQVGHGTLPRTVDQDIRGGAYARAPYQHATNKEKCSA